MINSKRLCAQLCALLCALLIGATLAACGRPPAAPLPASSAPPADGGTRYLPDDPEKGAAYAQAIDAYNAFLQGKTRAQGPDGTIGVLDETRRSDGQPGIDEYALTACDGSDYPLLHIRGMAHSVLRFTGSAVVLAYTLPETGLDGTTGILRTGAVYAKVTKPDFTAYTVVEFQGDAAAEVTFTQPADQNAAGYVFQGEELSRTAWENAAKPYLDLIAGQQDTGAWHHYAPDPGTKKQLLAAVQGNGELVLPDGKEAPITAVTYGSFFGTAASSAPSSAVEYTLVDLDGDKMNEMVVRMTDTAAQADWYLILRPEKGKICASGLTARQMVDLRTDGSFFGSEGAAQSTPCRARFADGRCTVEKAERPTGEQQSPAVTWTAVGK